MTLGVSFDFRDLNLLKSDPEVRKVWKLLKGGGCESLCDFRDSNLLYSGFKGLNCFENDLIGGGYESLGEFRGSNLLPLGFKGLNC